MGIGGTYEEEACTEENGDADHVDSDVCGVAMVCAVLFSIACQREAIIYYLDLGGTYEDEVLL